MTHEQFDRIFAPWIPGIGAAAMSVIGFLGFHFCKDDPQIKTKQFIGGVLLSAFTGGCTCILLNQTGLHPEISSVIASVLGSTGMKGFELMVQKAQNSIDKGE